MAGLYSPNLHQNINKEGGRNMGAYQDLYYSVNPNMDIDNATWFKDLTEGACKNSERSGRDIIIYFDSEEQAQACIKKAETRNISHGLMTKIDGTRKVYIHMNWTERRPTRMYPRHRQILT